MIQFLSKFFYILKGKKRQLSLLAFLFLFVSLLEALGIGLVGPFIALATNPKYVQQTPWLNWAYSKLSFTSEVNFLMVFGLLLMAVFYVKTFLSFNVQKYIFEFGFGQQGELSSKLLRAYLSAPYTFHLNRNTALLIQNIINETEKFSNGVMMPLLTSTSNVAILCALMLLLIKTNLIATVIISGVLLASFLFFQKLKDRLAHWGKEASESYTEMIRIINHGLGGLKETQIIGCESYFEQKMDEQTQRYATTTSMAVSLSNLPRYMIETLLITFLVGFTITFLAFNQENTQNINSVLGIYAMASIRLLPAVSNLIGSINGIRYSSYSLDQLYFDLKELEETELKGTRRLSHSTQAVSLSSGGNRVMPFVNQISLERIVYHYPNTSETALEGISLTIEKGQSIGLIGKSGAGKTTLVDVILGLLIPQSGDIKVDGVSVYNDLRSWQNLIGYVPQSIFLTDDALEKNIAFGVPDHRIDYQKLNGAIEAAQLTELVEQLPDGLKTAVGERGVRLSGGQRQRVGIARALYHEREILVLDEATAALDNETESLVSDAIKSLGGKKTVIIIAHRLSTIEHCDRIYKMEKGRIVTSGTYQEVVLKM